MPVASSGESRLDPRVSRGAGPERLSAVHRQRHRHRLDLRTRGHRASSSRTRPRASSTSATARSPPPRRTSSTSCTSTRAWTGAVASSLAVFVGRPAHGPRHGAHRPPPLPPTHGHEDRRHGRADPARPGPRHDQVRLGHHPGPAVPAAGRSSSFRFGGVNVSYAAVVRSRSSGWSAWSCCTCSSASPRPGSRCAPWSTIPDLVAMQATSPVRVRRIVMDHRLPPSRRSPACSCCPSSA